MEYKELVNENLRLAILMILEEAGGFSQNDTILHAFLDRIGHRYSKDKIRTELQWLADQELVTLSGVGTIMVATLTARGLDVANARTTVPGVKRPGPRN